jgi:hypothetical protein
MFAKNVGSIDRIIRIVLGVALLIAFFAMPEASYRWLLLIGIVPLATALMGSCPLYSIFGISTCPMKKS